jgi:hypothetical protein
MACSQLDPAGLFGTVNISAECVDASNVVMFRGMCGVTVANNVKQDLVLVLRELLAPLSHSPTRQ